MSRPARLERFITNKFPNEELPSDGKVIPHKIVDGKIKVPNGLREFDFVVNKGGKLIVGKRHHLLGDRQDVQAAGTMKLQIRNNWKLLRIDNLSGHYMPTVEETELFPDILRNAGVEVKGATLEISTIVNVGKISTLKVVSRKVCH